MGWSWLSRKRIRQFWSQVAQSGRYDEEPQTWEWELDLERATALIDEHQPEELISYGCADGCRDPEQLLEAASDMEIDIESVVAVDCTNRFASQVRRRTERFDISDFRFLLNKPEENREVRRVA